MSHVPLDALGHVIAFGEHRLLRFLAHHHVRAVEASLAYRVANLETRFARQHDVEDQEVKVLLNRAAQPEIAIGGDLHHVARGAEKIGDDEDNPGFILDEQNPGVHRAGRHTVKVAPAPGRLVTPMVPP